LTRIGHCFVSRPLAWAILAAVSAAALAEAPLPPLDDTAVTTSYLPAGIARSRPELYGAYAYLWRIDKATRVIQYHGDFSLHLGERRLESRDAVIWMTQRRWENQSYFHFEVYLSDNARVRESAGSLTAGPSLFVTFNTTEPPMVAVDASETVSSEDTKLYQEAAAVRTSILREASAATRPEGWEVVEPAAPRAVLPQKARPVVRYRAEEEVIDEQRNVILAMGNVYVSQGLVDSGDFLEIRADGAVLFLARGATEGEKEPASPSTAPGLAPFPTEEPAAVAEPEAQRAGIVGLDDDLGATIAGVYLQGDVILTRGERMIRASEIYYDFENDRALILDAVMHAMVPERDVPIYVRADQVRQLSSTEYAASDAMISSSEFYTPHVYLGAERVHLTDLTPRDEAGQVTGVLAGRYRMHDVTLNVEGVPVAYWPYTAGDFRASETSIYRFRTFYSDRYGPSVETKWYLFNLLGLEEPEGVEGVLSLDYYGQRGPGVGTDIDYVLPDSFGLFRGYFIYDQGEDGLGPFRGGPPDTETRGRLTWRHRELLGRGWELTLEGSYISDPDFLQEFFRSEFEETKEQETLIYLKKQQDNWAVTGLAQWRVLDFRTQTEHLPDLGFHWLGEPLGGVAALYHESHLGLVRYRPDDRRIFDAGRVRDNRNRSDVTFRTDHRTEMDVPFRLGSVNIVPYATGRAGYWDGSPEGGDKTRTFGSVGVRSGTQFWRLFEDVASELLGVNGVRHIIRPEVVAWMSASSVDSIELHPFDAGIEDIDDFYGTSVALRQRWQTRRGAPGEWEIVDWITLNLEANFFGNQPENNTPIGRFYPYRPENSVSRNHLRGEAIYRISDTTALLADSNFDMNDGSMDLFDLSYAVERTPRLAYFVGYRRIGDTDSNLLGLGSTYELNEKHRVAMRTYYDLERGETEQFDIMLIRKFPRWYGGLTFGLDNINEDISVGLTVWPEGAPQMAIGDRSFVRMAESTGIRPED